MVPAPNARSSTPAGRREIRLGAANRTLDGPRAKVDLRPDALRKKLKFLLQSENLKLIFCRMNNYESATTDSHLANEAEDWTLVLRSKTDWLHVHLSDLWFYRDLLWMFIRRDFVSVYKQTILGPIWFFIQPLLTNILLFGERAI